MKDLLERNPAPQSSDYLILNTGKRTENYMVSIRVYFGMLLEILFELMPRYNTIWSRCGTSYGKFICSYTIVFK